MTAKQLGKMVEQTREACKLSRAELAKKAKVSRSTIWRLETRGQCTLQHYLAVMRACSLTAGYDVTSPSWRSTLI